MLTAQKDEMGQILYAPYTELAKVDIDAGLDLLERDLRRSAPGIDRPVSRRATARILAAYAEANGQNDLARRLRDEFVV